MKKSILCLFLILNAAQAFAQIKVKTYSESIEHGFAFFADNNEPCEVSIKVTFDLKNLNSSAGTEHIFILPANSEKNKLSSLSIIKKGKKYSYSTQEKSNYGDHLDTDYDKDLSYYLPFEKNKAIKVNQGYNGTFSHQNKKQLDFKMPIGTKIVSARKGTVIKVVDLNNKTCPTEACKKYANYILIHHDDGTFAEYAHIKRKGAKVKVGEVVKAGQLIALSGNVGWSTGPHLHFSVFFQRLNGRDHLETKFKTGAGDDSKLLVEKEYYERNYD